VPQYKSNWIEKQDVVDFSPEGDKTCGKRGVRWKAWQDQYHSAGNGWRPDHSAGANSSDLRGSKTNRAGLNIRACWNQSEGYLASKWLQGKLPV
jgi:hypothetical protein